MWSEEQEESIFQAVETEVDDSELRTSARGYFSSSCEH